MAEPNQVGRPRNPDTVAVGCKLPHGIHMDITREGKPRERFTLRGVNSARVIGGFGITEGVPKEFFDEWMRQHKDHPAVKQGLIFAHAQPRSVEDMAIERKELKTGLEGLDPEKPAPGIKPLDKE